LLSRAFIYDADAADAEAVNIRQRRLMPRHAITLLCQLMRDFVWHTLPHAMPPRHLITPLA